MKIHDALTPTADGVPLICEEATCGAIYIVRNPLDLAVSNAHHNRTDIDSAITSMADESNSLVRQGRSLSGQLHQKLLSWSSHVKSWVDATGLDVCLIRYEDMLRRPLEAFGRAVGFCSLRTIRNGWRGQSGFHRLKPSKSRKIGPGSKETPSGVTCFFRKGMSGSWRESLTAGQVRRIVRDHGGGHAAVRISVRGRRGPLRPETPLDPWRILPGNRKL